jgi:hypothetical protein
MAERDQSKAQAKSKRTATAAAKPVGSPAKAAKTAPATPAKPPSKAAAEPPAAAIKRLEAEITALILALAEAQARITELERQRDSALDRIEWVIDSLHSLREEQG